ncbi:jg2136, partial [Pararge aegeria aegeria]
GAPTNTDDLTPQKPRLGRFLDIYSPEHLNLTPKPKDKLAFNKLTNDNPNILTPEPYSNTNDKCR